MLKKRKVLKLRTEFFEKLATNWRNTRRVRSVLGKRFKSSEVGCWATLEHFLNLVRLATEAQFTSNITSKLGYRANFLSLDLFSGTQLTSDIASKIRIVL